MQAHGSYYIGENELEYFAYGANHSASPANFLYGGRAVWNLPDQLASVGLSYQNGDRATGDSYNAFGADLRANYDWFGLKTEYIRAIEDGGDRQSVYAQPSVTYGKWTVFYRFDYIDLDTDATDDASEQIEHVVGLNYLLTPIIRLRGEYIFNDFDQDKDSLGQDRDFHQLQFSTTVSF